MTTIDLACPTGLTVALVGDLMICNGILACLAISMVVLVEILESFATVPFMTNLEIVFMNMYVEMLGTNKANTFVKTANAIGHF